MPRALSALETGEAHFAGYSAVNYAISHE